MNSHRIKQNLHWMFKITNKCHLRNNFGRNVYWLSNEHRKIRKSRLVAPDTICVVPYTSFCVQCLLLYQDWAKFVMILMAPEPCSTHQYLHATWSTFCDPFHTFSFTMQWHDQNSTLSLNLNHYICQPIKLVWPWPIIPMQISSCFLDQQNHSFYEEVNVLHTMELICMNWLSIIFISGTGL